MRVTMSKFFSILNYLMASKSPVILCDFRLRISVSEVFESLIFNPFCGDESRSKVFCL